MIHIKIGCITIYVYNTLWDVITMFSCFHLKREIIFSIWYNLLSGCDRNDDGGGVLFWETEWWNEIHQFCILLSLWCRSRYQNNDTRLYNLFPTSCVKRGEKKSCNFPKVHFIFRFSYGYLKLLQTIKLAFNRIYRLSSQF